MEMMVQEIVVTLVAVGAVGVLVAKLRHPATPSGEPPCAHCPSNKAPKTKT
jgi:hypothetical protein